MIELEKMEQYIAIFILIVHIIEKIEIYMYVHFIQIIILMLKKVFYNNLIIFVISILK